MLNSLNETNYLSALIPHVMSFVQAEKERLYLWREYQKALKVHDIKRKLTDHKPPIRDFLKELNQDVKSMPAIQIDITDTETPDCMWIVPTMKKPKKKSIGENLAILLEQALQQAELPPQSQISPRAMAIAVLVLGSRIEAVLSSMVDLNNQELAKHIVESMEDPLPTTITTSGIKLVSKAPVNVDPARMFYLRPDKV